MLKPASCYSIDISLFDIKKLNIPAIMKRSLLFIITTLLMLINLSSQTEDREKGLSMITEDALKAQIGFLASDWTEGRETGERGEFMSADYIASMLQLFGAKPAGDIVNHRDPVTRMITEKQTYYQSFTLQKTSPGDKQELAVKIIQSNSTRTIDFSYLTDFRVTPVYPGGIIEAPVVFVGYGYRNDDENYNDFSKTDVKGKFILRLSGAPEKFYTDDNPYLRYRLNNEKNKAAVESGALGIIEVNPLDNGLGWTEEKEFMNMSPSESRNYRRGPRYSLPADGMNNSIPSVTVSKRAANIILSGTGRTIEDYIAGKINNDSKGNNETLIVLRTSVNTSLVHVRNVLAKIEGKNKDEVLILGAHYDHIGMADGYINNGADDNASGTVGVLTIARAMAAMGVQPDKTIIFALWTGEEKGLLGSKYYVDNPTVPLNNIRLNVNFDMISRYITDDQPDKVTMTYTSSCPEFKDITARNIKKYKINLLPDYQPSDSPPGGSDHRSFVAKDIPVMRFKPGHRKEYHTPKDEISTINWDIMEKIVKIGFLNTWDLATSNW